VSLHGKKGLSERDKKRWHYDKILIHLKKFGPKSKCQESKEKRLDKHVIKGIATQNDIVTIDTKGIGIENKVTLWITTIDIKGLSNCQQLDACYKHMTLKNKKNCKGIRQHKDSGQRSSGFSMITICNNEKKHDDQAVKLWL
jgi:hypothetical protein